MTVNRTTPAEMASTSAPSHRLRGLPSSYPGSGSTRPLRSLSRELVVGFEPGRRRLPELERAVLERWLRAWRQRQPMAVVVMAHEARSHASVRTLRLRALRDTVERMGIQREHIKYTEQLVQPLPTSDRHAHVVDAVLLKVLDSDVELHDVRPASSCFDVIPAND
jgi:hypothetical protein